MNLSEIRRILSDEGLRLTRTLGQNFLHDQNQLRKIIHAASLKPNDHVLEVGPGLGPLTAALLDEVREVRAVEMDRRLCAWLERRFGDHPGFTLVAADAIEYIRTHPEDWSHWILVSNLPYGVASPLLAEMAMLPCGPRRLVCTVQREVARRLQAGPHRPHDYGVLTLLVQRRYAPGDSFAIPPSCFFPKPSVDSTCIVMHRRQSDLVPANLLPTYLALVKKAFSQRRKVMFKLLRELWPQDALESQYRQLNLPQNIRAEKVSLPQFVHLAHNLKPIL